MAVDVTSASSILVEFPHTYIERFNDYCLTLTFHMCLNCPRTVSGSIETTKGKQFQWLFMLETRKALLFRCCHRSLTSLICTKVITFLTTVFQENGFPSQHFFTPYSLVSIPSLTVALTMLWKRYKKLHHKLWIERGE